ncbi:hypothetical protein StoSoilB13_16610 [Arthrobacter sp. StoSoilB13]|nr:hypothetical protein StoSoilB13_16610 [Arthrobacter sp. StoSoilB13]
MHFYGTGKIAEDAAEGAAKSPQKRDGGVQLVSTRKSQPLGFSQIEMDDLAAGVDTGVGAAGNRDPHGTAHEERQSFLK